MDGMDEWMNERYGCIWMYGNEQMDGCMNGTVTYMYLSRCMKY